MLGIEPAKNPVEAAWSAFFFTEGRADRAEPKPIETPRRRTRPDRPRDKRVGGGRVEARIKVSAATLKREKAQGSNRRLRRSTRR
jgi:hypothetical protein